MTLKRIHREIADVAKEDLGPITLAPTAESLFIWKGSIPGPQGSPYEGGVFEVDVVLGNDYPYALSLFISLLDTNPGSKASQHQK
jgi:ubiquitin-conjugating enzyme E2 D/E